MHSEIKSRNFQISASSVPANQLLKFSVSCQIWIFGRTDVVHHGRDRVRFAFGEDKFHLGTSDDGERFDTKDAGCLLLLRRARFLSFNACDSCLLSRVGVPSGVAF